MPPAGGKNLSPSPKPSFIFRPPEAAFALIGVGAAVVLLARAGGSVPASREMAGGTVVYLSLLCSAWRWPIMADARVRLGINYLCAIWLYGATSRVTLALGSPAWDETLLGEDRRWFGETPSVGLQTYAPPWLTDVMSACYAFYHFYLHGMLIVVMFTGSSRAARHFGDCLYAGFAVGFVGYLLVPALGPGAAFPSLYDHPLAGGTATWLNAWLIGKGAAVYGTFPRLHVLITAILLDHDWRRCRRRFWWVLGPCLGLLASTLYLRYHYAADLLAGFAVFAVWRAKILRWSPSPP